MCHSKHNLASETTFSCFSQLQNVLASLAMGIATNVSFLNKICLYNFIFLESWRSQQYYL